MDAIDIRNHIIKPALQETDTWSEAAEILVYGTGWIESAYKYKEQIGNPRNGGLGYFQDEPSDYKEIYVFLHNNFNKPLSSRILAACNFESFPTDPRILISNIKYACLVCRVHYWQIKHPLPLASSARNLAEYHKRFYNSALGATDVDKSTEIFQRIINGEM